MALRAGNSSVGSQQWLVREGIVEGLGQYDRDRGVCPLGLGVAGTARRVGSSAHEAVEAARVLQVCRHLLMAGETDPLFGGFWLQESADMSRVLHIKRTQP